MDDYNLVPPGKFDQLGIEAVRRGPPQRVCRVGYNHKPGLLRQLPVKMLQVGKIIVLRQQRVVSLMKQHNKQPQQ